MILFFDVETTGLPKNYKASFKDLNNWPRIIQIAWLIYDLKGDELTSKSFIINPDGFIIPQESINIHKITNERAKRDGIYVVEALDDFLKDAKLCTKIVAHNLDYDINVLKSELFRIGKHDFHTDKELICTMELTTDFCAIPSKYGYKWPKLEELYFKLFKENIVGSHDALIDCEATAKCFWEMIDLGVLSNITFDENTQYINHRNPSKMEVAGFSDRLGAAIIDGLIIAFPVRVLSFGLNLNNVFYNMILYFLFFVIYHSLLETDENVSLGKRMTGLKVVDISFNNLSFTKAFQRNCMKYLSQIGLYIGFFMIAFTEKNQGLHDLISKTIVIKKESP